MEKIREQLKCKHLGYVCFIIAHTKQKDILFDVAKDLENIIARIFEKIDEEVNIILSLDLTEQALRKPSVPPIGVANLVIKIKGKKELKLLLELLCSIHKI
jgi:hypothetical protein